MQNEYNGFPLGGLEPQEWYPELYTGGSALNKTSPIKVSSGARQKGLFVTLGPMVFAWGDFVIATAGTANQSIRLVLPVPALDVSNVGQTAMTDTTYRQILGTFHYTRFSGGIEASGLITRCEGPDYLAALRAGANVTNNFGYGNAQTVTVGDIFSVQLNYLGKF